MKKKPSTSLQNGKRSSSAQKERESEREKIIEESQINKTLANKLLRDDIGLQNHLADIGEELASFDGNDNNNGNIHSPQRMEEEVKSIELLKHVKSKIKLNGTILYIGDHNMDLAVKPSCKEAIKKMNNSNDQLPGFFYGIRLILVLIDGYKLKTSTDNNKLSNASYEVVKFLNGENSGLSERITYTSSMKGVANKILELCKTELVIEKIRKEYKFQLIRR